MIRDILVPLDMSPLAEVAVPHVRAVAEAFEARVHLLSVVESPTADTGIADSVEWRLARDQRQAYLERIGGSLRKAGLSAGWETTGGSPAEQILEAARSRGADLVVLTTHGRGGVSEFRLSGTASKVVTRAETSVLVVRPRDDEEPEEAVVYRRILAPVDCSPRGDWAVCLAARLARFHHAELLLVAVVETPHFLGSPHEWSEQKELAERLAALDRKVAEQHLDELARKIDPDRRWVRTEILEADDAPRALQTLAEDQECSLLVLSAHGQSTGTGLPFGSVPRGLVEHCDRPVLVFQDARVSGRGPRLREEREERQLVGT